MQDDQSVDKKFPSLRTLFGMIAEPRNIRILMFCVYVAFVVAGVALLTQPPYRFQDIIGYWLTVVFGIVVLVGAMLCAIAILPGWWWVERSGLYLLAAGLGIYMTILSSLSASVFVWAVNFVVFAKFVQRWLEIRNAQLAPGDD